jgi:hypothetical protein
MQSSVAKANQRAQELQLKIERDKLAIRNLHAGGVADGVEEWTKLSEDAKAKLRSDTFNLLLVAVQPAIKAAGSLTPPQANRAISQLRAAGIDVAPLNASIRALAATGGKPAKAAAVNQLLDNLSQIKDTYSVATTKDSVALEAMSVLLSWLLQDMNPTLSVLTADLQFTTSSIYNNAARRVSQHQIEQLSRLSETDLKALKTLSTQLQRDVEEFKSTQQQLAALSTC